MKKKLTPLLLTIVVGAAVFLATKIYYDRQIEALYQMATQAQEESQALPESVEEMLETKETFRGAELEAELRRAGRLETAEYHYTAVESYDSSKSLGSFKIPGTTSRYIYSYDGRIVAGIEADRICIEVNDDARRVDIYIPPAEILSSEIYEDSFKLYDERNSIFNPVSVSDFNQSNMDLKAREEKKAIENGLLENAEQNGKGMIEAFVQTLPVPEDYTVTVYTDVSGTHTLPSSGSR